MRKKIRHRIVFKIVGPVLKTVLKRKFNLKTEKSKLKPPYIVLANHTTDYDAFFVASSFKTHTYFVMSDHVSSLKAGKLIKHLVSPIPITKSTVDAETVKNIFSILKQKGAVGIFPEGNKSFSGEPSKIKESTAKLVKKAHVPLVLYNIVGGYLSSPRWSKNKRKGEIRGFIREILTVDEIQAMTDTELYKKIVDGLNVNAYAEQEKEKVEFIGENKAENIEALLYYCPKCGAFNTIYGEGDNIKCSKCNLNATYNNYGYIENAPYERLDEWDKFQKEKLLNWDLNTFGPSDVITKDDGWEIQIKESKYYSVPLGTFTTELTKENLYFKNETDTICIPIPSITGTAIEGTCSIQLSLKDGTVYRLKKELNTNGLKYVNLIHKINGIPFKF